MSLRYSTQERTLLLDVPQIASVPDAIAHAARVRGFVPKAEHHVTLLCGKEGPLASALEINGDAVRALAEKFAWNISWRNEYVELARTYEEKTPPESRRTIIRLIDLPDLADFIHETEALLGIPVATPVPHVTLFSMSTNPKNMTRGIGVYSEDDLVRFRVA